MKLFYFILLLNFLPFQSMGQKWHYNGKNERGHQYVLWLQNLEDTNSYRLTKRINSDTSQFEVSFEPTDSIAACFFRLTNLDTKRDTIIHSSLGKDIVLELPSGSYMIKYIGSRRFDPFELKFKITRNETIELFVNFGLAPQFDGYFIYSRKKLTEAKISEIYECLNKGVRGDLTKQCGSRKIEVWLMY